MFFTVTVEDTNDEMPSEIPRNEKVAQTPLATEGPKVPLDVAVKELLVITAVAEFICRRPLLNGETEYGPQWKPTKLPHMPGKVMTLAPIVRDEEEAMFSPPMR